MKELYEKNPCSICYNNINEKYYLPCGHYFHENCVIEWIKNKYICPTCRIPIILYYSDYKKMTNLYICNQDINIIKFITK